VQLVQNSEGPRRNQVEIKVQRRRKSEKPLSQFTNRVQSIHFDFESSTSWTDKGKFNRSLRHDLELRGLDGTNGSVRSRIECLRKVLIQEWRYHDVRRQLDQGLVGRADALFLLMNAPICILHLEMRVSIKCIQMAVEEGWENVNEGTSTTTAPAGERHNNPAWVVYLENVQRVINCEILGTFDNPGQWKVPLSEDRKKIAPISFTNVKLRQIIEGYDKLVRVCINNEDGRRERWIDCVQGHFIPLMELLRSRVDLTSEQITEYQRHCDLFFNQWVSIHGISGVTNYIHFLGTGHGAEYLHEWGNMYQHSQQGWEAFNSLLKTFYFRRTQRGGYNKGNKTNLKPIAKWLQRRMVWMEGEVTYAEMVSFAKQSVSTREEQEEEEDEFDIHDRVGGGDATAFQF
jgi:hypothetical protein